MQNEPSDRSEIQQFPPDLSPDALTRYIYDHFPQFLTEEERAAGRVCLGRSKHLVTTGPLRDRVLELAGVPDVEAEYPQLMRRIDLQGVAGVMRATAERVLRDHLGEKILHTCAKCGELCRTPRAQQCFACGFDWHPETGA